MKIAEFLKFLHAKGVKVENGKKHYKLTLAGRHSTLPRHPGKELKEGTRIAICKQLNID
jgi:mRNA interferase HicA